MNWHYIENNSQKGPLPEDQFRKLINDGVIKADTLVWHPGMKDWVICSSLPDFSKLMPPSIGSVRCQLCWNEFPQADMVMLEGKWVCSACKPRYVQMMKEGIAGAGFLLLIAAIVASVMTTTVAARKIDENYVWLGGICKEYLAELPEWIEEK